MSELQSIIDSLQSENKSLKEVIEGINFEKNSLNHTVIELLHDKINMRTNIGLFEKRFNDISQQLKNEIDAKKIEISDLLKTIDELNLKIKELSS